MFGSSRPRETRHIFGSALKAGGDKSYINIGAVKLRETNPKNLEKSG